MERSCGTPKAREQLQWSEADRLAGQIDPVDRFEGRTPGASHNQARHEAGPLTMERERGLLLLSPIPEARQSCSAGGP